MKDPRNVLEKALAKNEPVFVVRAQDIFALAALDTYINEALSVDASLYPTNLLEELLQIKKDFVDWKLANKGYMKYPD